MKKRAMLERFDLFATRISQRYAEARVALERGDYVKAHDILTQLTMSHARTALSLRNQLVKDGLMEGDKK